MWILKSRSKNSVFYIKTDSANVIGRNVGNLTFPADKSISRKHATVCMNKNENVTIEDHGSKYGTYINEGIQAKTKIESNTPFSLSENSVIMFGVLGNEWSLTKQIYKSCLSTIKEADLASVRAELDQLSVTISKEWTRDCTHLTMPSITLTIKVVLALVQNKPIVKPEFWTECLKCRDNNLPLPVEHSYLPDVKESSISEQANFNIDPKRKELFAGKTFIFMSRQQMKNYEEIIDSAGGQSCYLGGGRVTHGKLTAPESIVIQHAVGYKSSQDTQELQGKIDSINKYMTSKKKRSVPEVEIGLAILYVSIDTYCNPSFNFASVILQDNVVSVEPENKIILAPETQETTSTASLQSLPVKYINETLSSSIAKEQTNLLSSTPSNTSSASKRRATKSPTNTEFQNLAKKINIDSRHKSAQQGDEDNLFSFVNGEKQTRSVKETPESFELTLQSVKRKRQNVFCDDENHFNFIPDVNKKIKSTETNQSALNIEKCDNNLLNIGKNTKRKHDGSDTPDGKRSNVTTNKSIKNFLLNETKYSCQKRFTDIVKIEDDETTLEVLTKLKDLDILPAVVVVCQDLIVKKDNLSNKANFNCTTKSNQRNFKKFVKVKPQRTCDNVISSNMLVEYQPKSSNTIPGQFLANSSDEEDEEDTLRSFGVFNSRQQVTRGRSRRL